MVGRAISKFFNLLNGVWRSSGQFDELSALGDRNEVREAEQMTRSISDPVRCARFLKSLNQQHFC